MVGASLTSYGSASSTRRAEILEPFPRKPTIASSNPRKYRRSGAIPEVHHLIALPNAIRNPNISSAQIKHLNEEIENINYAIQPYRPNLLRLDERLYSRRQ